MPVGAKYKPKDKSELLDLLRDGVECKNIDFSLLVDLKELFYNKEYILLQKNVYFVDPNNPNLLIWNTSNVTDMSSMFEECKNFNKPVKLDTSNVVKMSNMFRNCEIFNQPIKFDTSKVSKLYAMFQNCKEFNQSLDFDLYSATNINFMFFNCENLNSVIKLKNIGRNVNKIQLNFCFEKDVVS